MRGPHVRFCERRDGAIHRAYSTPHERQTVVDNELGLIVRQVIQRLQNQYLKHDQRIQRRSPAFGTVRAFERFGQRLAKHLPWNNHIELLKRIARFAQQRIALFHIPETRLTKHPANSKSKPPY